MAEPYWRVVCDDFQNTYKVVNPDGNVFNPDGGFAATHWMCDQLNMARETMCDTCGGIKKNVILRACECPAKSEHKESASPAWEARGKRLDEQAERLLARHKDEWQEMQVEVLRDGVCGTITIMAKCD